MSEVTNFLSNRRNLVNLLVLSALMVGLPFGIQLAKNQQILRSRATVVPIVFIQDDTCVLLKKGNPIAKCKTISLQLTSTIGPPGIPSTGSASPSPSSTASATPSPSVSSSPSTSARPSPSPSVSSSPSTSARPSPSPSCSPNTCNPQLFDSKWCVVKTRSCDNHNQRRVTYQCKSKKKTFKESCGGGAAVEPPVEVPVDDGTFIPSFLRISEVYAQELAGSRRCKPNKFDPQKWTMVGSECVPGKAGRIADKWVCKSTQIYKNERDDASCTAGGGGSPPPSGGQFMAKTFSYKIVENPVDLPAAVSHKYENEPTITDITFQSDQPGVKNVFVEFTGVDNNNNPKIARETAQIKLVGVDPHITSMTCRRSLSDQNVKVKINGESFGQDRGTIVNVASGSAALAIDNWNDNLITGSLNIGNSDQGGNLTLKLTRSDDTEVQNSCSINALAQLSLGAQVICRTPLRLDVGNVGVVVMATPSGQINRETAATIDRDGLLQGMRSRFEVGKDYLVYIKAPKSLRRSFRFTATDGTSQIDNFILPVGDIYPLTVRDNRIDTFDLSELIREWGLVTSAPKPADFNLDNKVNSFDFACLRHDLTTPPQTDEPDPGGIN